MKNTVVNQLKTIGLLGVLSALVVVIGAVLGRRAGGAEGDDARRAEVFSNYCAQTTPFVMPAGFSLKSLMLPGGFPRCRDRDDEHFLALAYHARADALVSRDNAVYGLKVRAAKFGVNILNVPQLMEFLAAPAVESA